MDFRHNGTSPRELRHGRAQGAAAGQEGTRRFRRRAEGQPGPLARLFAPASGRSKPEQPRQAGAARLSGARPARFNGASPARLKGASPAQSKGASPALPKDIAPTRPVLADWAGCRGRSVKAA